MSLKQMSALHRKAAAALAVVAVLGLSACTSNDPGESNDNLKGGTSDAEAGSNDEAGDKVTIGFSAPAADHGWMASITESARAVAEQYEDVELRRRRGHQRRAACRSSQVETFINDKVDAIVLLPFDGAALTPIALEAMEAGIPVINVDREFNDPNAARVTVLGDNYGMGVSRRRVHLRAGRGQLRRRRRRDRRHRLAAPDPGPQPGLQGRARGVRSRRRQPGRRRLHRPGRRGGRDATCSRPRRRSTASGTTTTTRASACSRPSTTPVATSSS